MPHLKAQPALVIIDMQNGFCHASGSFAQIGLPASRHASVIQNIKQICDLCRAHSVPVFYTAVTLNEDYSNAGIMNEGVPELKAVKAFVRDTWDAAIVDELKPAEGKPVVQKTHNNSFWKTDLVDQLRKRGIDQIIATGVATNVCVEPTVREAKSNGFYAVTMSDGTQTLSEEEHQASLLNLKYFGGSMSTQELQEELHARAQGKEQV